MNSSLSPGNQLSIKRDPQARTIGVPLSPKAPPHYLDWTLSGLSRTDFETLLTALSPAQASSAGIMFFTLPAPGKTAHGTVPALYLGANGQSDVLFLDVALSTTSADQSAVGIDQLIRLFEWMVPAANAQTVLPNDLVVFNTTPKIEGCNYRAMNMYRTKDVLDTTYSVMSYAGMVCIVIPGAQPIGVALTVMGGMFFAADEVLCEGLLLAIPRQTPLVWSQCPPPPDPTEVTTATVIPTAMIEALKLAGVEGSAKIQNGDGTVTTINVTRRR